MDYKLKNKWKRVVLDNLDKTYYKCSKLFDTKTMDNTILMNIYNDIHLKKYFIDRLINGTLDEAPIDHRQSDFINVLNIVKNITITDIDFEKLKLPPNENVYVYIYKNILEIDVEAFLKLYRQDFLMYVFKADDKIIQDKNLLLIEPNGNKTFYHLESDGMLIDDETDTKQLTNKFKQIVLENIFVDNITFGTCYSEFVLKIKFFGGFDNMLNVFSRIYETIIWKKILYTNYCLEYGDFDTYYSENVKRFTKLDRKELLNIYNDFKMLLSMIKIDTENLLKIENIYDTDLKEIFTKFSPLYNNGGEIVGIKQNNIKESLKEALKETEETMNLEDLSYMEIVDIIQGDDKIGAEMLHQIALKFTENKTKIKELEEVLTELKNRNSTLISVIQKY